MNKLEAPIRGIGRDRGNAEAGVGLIALSYLQGVWLDPHRHHEAQLVYAASGTMQVTTPKGRWLVPPDRAVWVPGGLTHEIHMLADIQMRTLYFEQDWLDREGHGDRLDQEFVIQVSPLLQQAILALFDGNDDALRTALLVRLALRELRQVDDSSTFVPLPNDPRCRRAAELVLAAPGDVHEITTLAEEVGTSARTLSRLFVAETRLSFKAWCQRARIAAAIGRLSTERHLSVGQLASDLGYASVPAFSHAFRQVTGKSPTEFAGQSSLTAVRVV
ncbi:AraC family transcriptional regulator [Bradyrhizobium sp.]|uniref:AraC family transcriptional regulator n=1 Tax=Bradyrhizobium sp. TaxID=376 RepID=UPI0039E48B70